MATENTVNPILHERNKNKKFECFVLRIIDEYSQIRENRLRLLLFLGEAIYIQKTRGEIMGDDIYQFNTGFWSSEYKELIYGKLPKNNTINIERKNIVPCTEPITYIKKPSEQLSYDTYDCKTNELGGIVADATIDKSLTELRFWYEHSSLGGQCEKHERFTQEKINWYVRKIENNKLIPVWSTLI